MDICYLCGQQMIEKKDYIQDQSTPIPKFKHDEHIIQNALYGRLTANNILCETCGSKLSRDVDTNFVELFNLFTAPINHILASKDRGGNFSKTLYGHIKKKDGTKIDVHVKDGKIAPRNPDYDYNKDSNTVKIYASNGKTLKGYKIFVLNKLKNEGIDIENLNVELINNIQDYQELGIYFSEGVVDFNSKFKLGLSKIATGFASSKGIEREDMPCTIDAKNEKIVSEGNIVPFCPLGIFDRIIEPVRSLSEDGFPTHTIILYTDRNFDKTKLVCYIDLFSTFQYYVVLNHDYKGKDVLETYYQTIIKREKLAIDIRYTRPKYLMIIADDLGVDKSEMKDMTLEEIYDFLEKKLKQYSVKYTLDLNDYVAGASAKFLQFMTYKNSPELLSRVGLSERQIIEGIPDIKGDDVFILYHESQRIENEKPETFYRQQYLDVNDNKEVVFFSTLRKMVELMNTNEELIKTYTNFKFYMLSQFVNANSEK
ncbi:HNH endonuclease [Flavobacterium lindanitolerans]|uniref:HNH endonuclease n=1 Tax=Flavobacterium lindanitolerans TaxID=428988 RepID=UPI0031AAE96B